ncbi:MAG: MBL fold metallo-hydrolase [Deltaproteobacteria bacterium]|nr:MBL fold metallo-hydrolase [Deltaproteobacteria bacterium]
MKITIVYDNETLRDGLIADWGFACVADAEGVRILFDTGANSDILLHNMRNLGVAPASIDEIFISHSHWDHTGGLSGLLNIRQGKIKVYIPASCSGDSDAADFVTVSDPLEIRPRIFSTGELRHIEQSLAVKTEEGVVVIAGCSHPGVREILDAVAAHGRVKALVGGLHGFNEFDLLRDMDVVCATHCTQHKEAIASLYPEKFIRGGVGTVINL